MAAPNGNEKKPVGPIGFDAKPGGPNGGFLVSKVDRFTPGAKAGVLVGDEVMMFQDAPIPGSGEEMNKLLESIGVGGTLKVTVLRAGAKHDLGLVLTAKRKVLSLELEEIDEVLERKISP
jgi:S1-C subfamily serine protease